MNFNIVFLFSAICVELIYTKPSLHSLPTLYIEIKSLTANKATFTTGLSYGELNCAFKIHKEGFVLKYKEQKCKELVVFDNLVKDTAYEVLFGVKTDNVLQQNFSAFAFKTASEITDFHVWYLGEYPNGKVTYFTSYKSDNVPQLCYIVSTNDISKKHNCSKDSVECSCTGGVILDYYWGGAKPNIAILDADGTPLMEYNIVYHTSPFMIDVVKTTQSKIVISSGFTIGDKLCVYKLNDMLKEQKCKELVVYDNLPKGTSYTFMYAVKSEPGVPQQFSTTWMPIRTAGDINSFNFFEVDIKGVKVVRYRASYLSGKYPVNCHIAKASDINFKFECSSYPFGCSCAGQDIYDYDFEENPGLAILDSEDKLLMVATMIENPYSKIEGTKKYAKKNEEKKD